MILYTTAAVVLVAVLTFLSYEIQDFFRAQKTDIKTIAEVVARNSSGALPFQDREDAQRTLNSLEAEKTVRVAVLYDETGVIFAYYPDNAPDSTLPLNPGPDRAEYDYQGWKLVVVTPVIEKLRVGTLYVEADLSPLVARLQVYAVVVALVLAGSFGVAYLISFWIERRVTQPILELAQVAARVSEHRDYSVRAVKRTEDEIGALTAAFNEMLSEIAERDMALRQSTERLQLALEASQTGTWDWDVRSDRLIWDHHLHNMFGLSPGEFRQTYVDFINRVHPEDRAEIDQLVSRSLEQKREFTGEFRVLWPDKSIHHVTARGRTFSDETGKVARMAGVAIDVTEERKAEQNLRESEERFWTMADAAPVLIWTSDMDKGRHYFNKSWLRFTGRPIEQETGEGWVEGMHPEDREAARIAYAQAWNLRREFEIEYRLRRADGEHRIMREKGIPRFSPDGGFRGYIGSCLDITDIRNVQAELERRVEARTSELAESNRELESFTYSVSHDLRAPLRHINAFAKIIEEGYGEKLDDDGKRYLGRIQAGAKNMGALVDDLLHLSRVGRQEFAMLPCNLDEIVAELVEETRHEHVGRAIEWRLGPLGQARCDAGLMRRALTNLISNAVKYTRGREKAVIELGKTLRSGEPVYFIKDNGVGFDMKYASKLFGVFQRLHTADEFEGTGVGLAIVDRIIRRHGGKIWAEAELDKGAKFEFILGGKVQDESRGS